MKLARYLSTLGYGSRREVEARIARGAVTSNGSRVTGDFVMDSDTRHVDLLVDGEPLDPPPNTIIALHKPCGYVTSTRDAGQTVYALLPARFLLRRPIIAPVGRLDLDTSGLLLFTDDGALNHRLTSPRHHVPKRYEATLASPIEDAAIARLGSGTLILSGEEHPIAPAQVTRLAPSLVRVVVHEGRYHQVRRMFAAVGHHVSALRRTHIGGLALGALPEGSWRVLDGGDLAALTDATSTP